VEPIIDRRIERMKKIILVEDSILMVQCLTAILKEHFKQAAIVVFDSEKPAKRAIRGKHADFDVLLLDGQLLSGHGRGVLKILTKKQIQKTVVISGSEEFWDEAAKMGVKSFMDKSFEKVPAGENGITYMIRIIRSVQ
jgi:DNA-binding NtrC family response regulator